MINLDGLNGIRDAEAEASFRNKWPEGQPRPDVYITGYLGSMVWSASQDADGHTEIAISGQNSRPTDAQARAFARRLGGDAVLVETPREELSNRYLRHFVVMLKR